ncbi:ABC transporter permease [Streptomyces iranensis]|uniref:ABC transport system permease protein n=1 Tax=Streptomyces iranensis TaxID=576784 RepID=A0A061A5Z5_9ACTN|nr:ABC transporter permease [Streptomyces iranensis]MBP2066224.1 putative ABC transport system permease protein [Streptomyces iranensis]CDR12968.1 ABC transporter related protein [Streptomyces iranensis]
MTARLPRPARLRPADLLRLGLLGPRTRRLRSALSALGIALGIAAVVAVTGISASNQAHLLDRLDRLGSNLITVSPGEDYEGKKVPLPKESVTMLGNIAPVERVSATGDTKANVYRNEFVPSNQTNSLRVLSARLDLLTAVRGEVRTGRWLDHATERLPVVVLGSSSAERLGVTAPGTKVWIAGEGLTGEWYGVLGILEPNELVPEIDDSVLVGGPTAIARLDGDRTPSTVYLRVHPDRVSDVQDVAAATANPAQPGMVAVSRPSDLLKARAETDDTLTGLVLSLAGVALLVGGVGIANTMVVGVMERRGEVGLRRALGARRGQIAAQFLIEAVLLGLFGGLAGAALGAATVYAYATGQGWPAAVPLVWAVAGPAVAVVVGTVAGLYPALRAAGMSPTGALRSA